MSKLTVVHPLLFAMFPVLALYAHNVAEVSPSEIVLPTATVLGSTLLLLLLSGVILRDIRKAGIVLSILLALFFSYGHILTATAGGTAAHRAAPNIVLMSIWGVLFICSCYFVIKTRRDLRKPTTILNIVAATLVIVPTIGIVAHEVEVARHDIKRAENRQTYAPDSVEADTLPDIYYIVLDRYASASTLKEVYDFDNGEFIDYLSNKGFYVASESSANYLITPASLASSLNMEYINYLGEELGEGFIDFGPMYAMMQDYEVWRFLKSQGYTFIHFGSWWEGTRENTYADKNINYPQIPEFSMLVLETTALYPVLLELDVVNLTKTQWKRVMYKFDKLAEIPDMKEPTFVFAHFLIPHDPYVFDRNGNYLTPEKAHRRSRNVNYLDQLVFINSKLTVLVDELLARSEVPPIIILQSDEGPYPESLAGNYNFRWEQATEAQLRQKMRILNAYYLPEVDKNDLYPSITPVNSFRLIFNLYLDTDFELLPDRNYVNRSGHPYKYLDVTDKVDYD